MAPLEFSTADVFTSPTVGNLNYLPNTQHDYDYDYDYDYHYLKMLIYMVKGVKKKSMIKILQKFILIHTKTTKEN